MTDLPHHFHQADHDYVHIRKHYIDPLYRDHYSHIPRLRRTYAAVYRHPQLDRRTCTMFVLNADRP